MPIQLDAQQLRAAGIQTSSSLQLYPSHHNAGDAGLPMLVIENPLCRAVVALQGAHVMAFQPAGQPEMFWVSPKTALQDGTAIRGGIPLCLPWFGPAPDGKMVHGFSRLKEWNLVAAERLADGATRLAMELAGDASTSAYWPHAFAFRMEIEAGATLKLGMTVENRGTDAAPLTFAFHTYFATPDVAKARVAGLDGITYIDRSDEARKMQNGDVTINGFTDRIYLDVPAKQTVLTGASSAHIESATKCSVVWNAWNNDANIVDMGAGNHVGYLCVERGDVSDHARTLPPGGKYQAWMTLGY